LEFNIQYFLLFTVVQFLSGRFGFLRELYSLAGSSFYIEIYTPGDVLLLVSNFLCLFSWGFKEHCIELGNGGTLAYFIVSR
jgi:hypothetical protein